MPRNDSVRQSTRVRTTRLIQLGSFMALLAAWWTASLTLDSSRAAILPSPTKVMSALVAGFVDDDWMIHLITSGIRVALGVFFAVLAAIVLGVLAGMKPSFEAVLSPVLWLRYVPVPAMVPLSILIAGIDDAQKIVLLFVGTFVHILPIIIEAVQGTDRHLLDIARTSGVKGFALVDQVVVPNCAPAFWDVARASTAIGWSYVVLVEIVGSNTGIGHVISASARGSRFDRVIGAIVILLLVGMILDWTFKVIRRRLFPWSDEISLRRTLIG